MSLSIPPWSLSWLALLGPLLLFLSLQGASPKRAFLVGLTYGLAYFGLSISWVYVSIQVHGYAPVPLAVFLTALFVLGLALLLPGTQTLCYRLLSRRGESLLLFAALWVTWEWISTWLFSGFPWLLTGHALIETPWAGYAPIGGALLVSLAALLTSLFLWPALARGRLWALAIPISLTLGGLALQQVSWVEDSERSLQVTLVQGNILQETKWRRESIAPILETHMRLSEAHWQSSDLVVWPEAAITLPLESAADLLDSLEARMRPHGGALISGILSHRKEGNQWRSRNLAIALGDGEGQYAKRRLVPFGEYIPLENLLRGLIDFFNLPQSRTRPGPWEQANLRIKGAEVGIAICYEIVYPELVRQEAKSAELLLTISNDTWFGDSPGAWQHIQIARMRALENGRYLVRATNNGVTAIVDPKGEIQSILPRFQEQTLTGEVFLHTEQTPFTRFGFLPWLLLTLGLGATALILRVFRRGRETNPEAPHKTLVTPGSSPP